MVWNPSFTWVTSQKDLSNSENRWSSMKEKDEVDVIEGVSGGGENDMNIDEEELQKQVKCCRIGAWKYIFFFVSSISVAINREQGVN